MAQSTHWIHSSGRTVYRFLIVFLLALTAFVGRAQHSATGINPLCPNEPSGRIAVNIDTTILVGSTEPFSFVWVRTFPTFGAGSGSLDTSGVDTITGLTRGTYSVTLYATFQDIGGNDSAGPIHVTNVTLNNPSAINPSISVTVDESCNGSADGSLTATPTNGVAPFT